MKTLGVDLAAALADPERYGCVLFTFVLGPNTYGLWTGAGNREYNGIIYGAGGSVLELDGLDLSSDGSTSEFNLRLSQNDDLGLTVDILSSFYAEEWHMQNMTVELGMRDPNTDEILGLTVMFDGLIYQAPLLKDERGYYISMRCVSQAIHMGESGGKYRNKASQLDIDPADTSLKDVGALLGKIQRTFKWGQK